MTLKNIVVSKIFQDRKEINKLMFVKKENDEPNTAQNTGQYFAHLECPGNKREVIQDQIREGRISLHIGDSETIRYSLLAY